MSTQMEADESVWVKLLAELGEELTYAAASTSLQNTPCSLLGIFWKLVILQKFRVRTQSHHLSEDGSIRIKQKQP